MLATHTCTVSSVWSFWYLDVWPCRLRRKRAPLLLQNCSGGNKPALFFQTRQTRQTKTHILNSLTCFDFFVGKAMQTKFHLPPGKKWLTPISRILRTREPWVFAPVQRKRFSAKCIEGRFQIDLNESRTYIRHHLCISLASLRTTSKKSCCFETTSWKPLRMCYLKAVKVQLRWWTINRILAWFVFPLIDAFALFSCHLTALWVPLSQPPYLLTTHC